MFAQNSDLIEEHLKAAFKAATDANLALREEVNVLKKNLAADTERSHAVDHDIMRAQDDQRDLTRRLKELCDVQMRYARLNQRTAVCRARLPHLPLPSFMGVLALSQMASSPLSPQSITLFGHRLLQGYSSPCLFPPDRLASRSHASQRNIRRQQAASGRAGHHEDTTSHRSNRAEVRTPVSPPSILCVLIAILQTSEGRARSLSEAVGGGEGAPSCS